MTPHDEPPRDAWLSEALRHAPDADAAPSAELSEAILRHARQAVNVPHARAAARTHPLLQLWSWLARPPVAAGFATLMVATLVGVMWWDRPLEDAMPRANAPAATPAATQPPVVAAPAPAPAPAPTVDASKPVVAQAEQAAPRAAARPAPPKRERGAERRAAAPASDEPRPRADEAVPAPAPATQAGNATLPAREEAEAAAPGGAPPRALAKAAPAAPSTAMALRSQDTDTRTPTIDQAKRWTWQRTGGIQAMTPALQRWLVQLERAARWRPAEGAPPPAADGRVLTLWRDGTLRTTIQLGDDMVWLTPPNGATAMAPLTPASAASLKAALIDAAP